jgi:hypothetical protein
MPCEILYVYARIYQFRLLTLSPRLNLKLEDVLLRIYVIFQMAGRARRGQNERVPPPPPPPPTLQELMAQQNEILRQLAQLQPPPQHYGGDHQRHPAAATYQEFLSTQPPLFTRAEDPLDADVWLRVVESKSRYSMEFVQWSLKSGSPPSSFADPQGLGGTTFLLCSQMTERWNGESSRQLSGGTIYQPELWTESSMSFWHSLRATGQCCSMLRPLMTCASMPGTMQTWTRRREIGSGGGSALSSVTVSTPSGPTTIMSWSTWPSPRRTVSPLVRPRRRGRPLWQDPQLSHSASGLCPTLRTGGLSSSKGDG